MLVATGEPARGKPGAGVKWTHPLRALGAMFNIGLEDEDYLPPASRAWRDGGPVLESPCPNRAGVSVAHAVHALPLPGTGSSRRSDVRVFIADFRSQQPLCYH